MITGTVNSTLDATLPLILIDVNGRQHSIIAVLDTGFGGSLALPPSQIAFLGWPWVNRVRGVLADGNGYVLEVYEGTILWDGQIHQVNVQALDSYPRVGMKLLHNHEIKITVVDGGGVTIQPLTIP